MAWDRKFKQIIRNTVPTTQHLNNQEQSGSSVLGNNRLLQESYKMHK